MIKNGVMTSIDLLHNHDIIPETESENILIESNYVEVKRVPQKQILKETTLRDTSTESSLNGLNNGLNLPFITSINGISETGAAACEGVQQEVEIPLEIYSFPAETEILDIVPGESMDSAPIESLELGSNFESIEMANLEFNRIEFNFNRIAKKLFHQKMNEIENESESIRNGVNPTLRQKMIDLERNHQQRLCDLKAHKEYQLALIRKEKEIELELLKCRFNSAKRQIRRTFLDNTHSLMYKSYFLSSFEELKDGQDSIYQYSLHPFYHKRQAIQDMQEIHYISTFGFPSATLWGLEDNEIDCDLEALGIDEADGISIVNTPSNENIRMDSKHESGAASIENNIYISKTEKIQNSITKVDEPNIPGVSVLSGALYESSVNTGGDDNQIPFHQDNHQPPVLVQSSQNTPCNILQLRDQVLKKGDFCYLFDNDVKLNVKIVYIQDDIVLVERPDGSQTMVNPGKISTSKSSFQ